MAERNFNPEGPGPWWVVCRDGEVAMMSEQNHGYTLTTRAGVQQTIEATGLRFVMGTSVWDVMQIIGPIEVPEPPKPEPVLFDGPGFYRLDDGRVVFVREWGSIEVLIVTSGLLSYRHTKEEFTEKLATWDEVTEWLESR